LASSAEVRGYISKIRTSLKISGLNNPKDLIITDSSEGYRYTP
jgi:hypothetical protein